MSKVKVEYLRKLLDVLASKTRHSFNVKGFKQIADDIEGIGEDYLYKKIFQPIKKLKGTDTIGLHEEPLNTISRYLGYLDFNQFKTSLHKKKDKQLLSLAGHYYSYVRSNADTGIVLRSPVRIWEESDGRIMFELKGPSLLFAGTIRNRHGCLFILLEAAGGKAFHHIYKIGIREKPSVLQGVFSGVSTAFDPIGGRVVLIRADEAYEVMKNKSLKTDILKKSKVLEEKKLAAYFNDYYNNNVAPNRSSTFGLGDL